jgi:hypothetical protein
VNRATLFVRLGEDAVPIGVLDLDDGAIFAPNETKRSSSVAVDYERVGKLTATALGYVRTRLPGSQRTLQDGRA